MFNYLKIVGSIFTLATIVTQANAAGDNSPARNALKQWYLVQIKRDFNPRSIFINGEQRFGYALGGDNTPLEVTQRGIWQEEVAPVGTSYCMAEDGALKRMNLIRAGTEFVAYDDGIMLVGWRRNSDREQIELTCSIRKDGTKFGWAQIHPLVIGSSHYKDVLTITPIFRICAINSSAACTSH